MKNLNVKHAVAAEGALQAAAEGALPAAAEGALPAAAEGVMQGAAEGALQAASASGARAASGVEGPGDAEEGWAGGGCGLPREEQQPPHWSPAGGSGQAVKGFLQTPPASRRINPPSQDTQHRTPPWRQATLAPALESFKSPLGERSLSLLSSGEEISEARGVGRERDEKEGRAGERRPAWCSGDLNSATGEARYLPQVSQVPQAAHLWCPRPPTSGAPGRPPLVPQAAHLWCPRPPTSGAPGRPPLVPQAAHLWCPRPPTSGAPGRPPLVP
nr:skin secretory protein xP2-like [Procambarus clarkii]